MTAEPDITLRSAPISKVRLRAWLKLLKVTGQIEAALRRKLRDDHATTLPRFDVMAALARYPEGLKMSDLSGYLRVSNGNVTGIIDRLSEDGLALRVAVAGDRRAHIARLTPAGEAAFAAMAAEHEAWIDSMLAALDADAARQLTALLARVDSGASAR
ncbi:MAG: MarR family transcriptional regulator [Pseudomonadota bacterium]